jgi:hypothetical protein
MSANAGFVCDVAAVLGDTIKGTLYIKTETLKTYSGIFKARFQNFEKRILASSCLSASLYVRLCAWNNLAFTVRIFMKFDFWMFFENLSRKFKFDETLIGMTGTLHEDLCTFMIISRSILLRIKHVWDKSFRGNQNKHIIFNNFFRKLALYEVMWKNMVQPDGPHTI